MAQLSWDLLQRELLWRGILPQSFRRKDSFQELRGKTCPGRWRPGRKELQQCARIWILSPRLFPSFPEIF